MRSKLFLVKDTVQKAYYFGSLNRLSSNIYPLVRLNILQCLDRELGYRRIKVIKYDLHEESPIRALKLDSVRYYLKESFQYPPNTELSKLSDLPLKSLFILGTGEELQLEILSDMYKEDINSLSKTQIELEELPQNNKNSRYKKKLNNLKFVLFNEIIYRISKVKIL